MIPIGDENPSSIRPVVTWGIIALNVIAFIWEVSGDEARYLSIVSTYGFIPALILMKQTYYMFLTSMFLHSDIIHLGGNMLYLFIFGDNVEDSCGHISYAIFYLISGVIASLLFMLFTEDYSVPAIGASGAISGVLGGYLILFPTARVRTIVLYGWFARIIRIPAYALIGFWFIYQFLFALSFARTGVAYWAHVGGFAAGILIIKLFAKRRDRSPTYTYHVRDHAWPYQPVKL
jgi:membrane associated rhomboid family serine protease